MKRRPREGIKPAIWLHSPLQGGPTKKVGLVLSGGGARAAYQAGALAAITPYLQKSESPISVVAGSSIGAINGLVLAAGLKQGISQSVATLAAMWRERSYSNTFVGSPSSAFLKAIRIAVLQYMSPGPNPTSDSIFDPTPLMVRVDEVIEQFGGLHPDNRCSSLESIAVMTTIEGAQRKPLLFLSSKTGFKKENLTGASFEICSVDSMTAKHGFASAALPSVLPPVEIDTFEGRVRLVDGGISQNVPVDPVVRLGAERVIVIDVSGRDWWLDQHQQSHDTRPVWEIPAGLDTFCFRPPETFVSRCQKSLGTILKESVQGSSKKFMRAVGPTWPIFTLLKRKLGEEVAYEAMSYVALDEDYIAALIERGYNETISLLRNKVDLEFKKIETYEKWVETL
jgi:predicted acylesterase/phospholipase RssA